MAIQKAETKAFGKQNLNEFLFAEEYLNLNHGSFGTYPRVIRDLLRKYQDQAEARPDVFERYDYPVLLDESRAEIAKLLNVPVGEVVFIPNATTGINTVLRNLVWEKGDVIIYFATIYGGCEKSVKYITEMTLAEDHKIEYTYPISNKSLVSKFEDAIKNIRKQGKRPRLAIYDTVVSMPGLRMPYETLTAVCKREGLLSYIDAAHAVGMLSLKDLDLGGLQPDFFVSNCHKWLFVPRGCAVFHVPIRNQKLLPSTLPTSHGFVPTPKPGAKAPYNPLPMSNKTPFVTNFEFVGTIDNTPYLCVPAGIQYRLDRYGGEDAIAAYLKHLARRAGEIVSEALGTDVIENEEGTLQNCAFSNVRLPLPIDDLVQVAQKNGPVTSKDALAGQVRDWVSLVFIREYGTFIQVHWYGGRFWARLCAQVYLEEEHFVFAAGVLKKVCERALKGEWLTGMKNESKL